MDFVFIAAGLDLLFIGGELLVRGSVAIAERLGMSSLLIGLTVVGFGTSTPELLVSVDAALRGSPEIAIGNVVGSNIANILLILGIAAVIAPIAGWQRTVARDALAMTIAALALFGLVQAEQIGRIEGWAFLGVLIIYLLASYWLERRDRHPTVHEQETREFQDIPVRMPCGACQR